MLHGDNPRERVSPPAGRGTAQQRARTVAAQCSSKEEAAGRDDVPGLLSGDDRQLPSTLRTRSSPSQG